MATKKGLLDNPNARTQEAPRAAEVKRMNQTQAAAPVQPQQGQPMQTTSATQPATNVPKPGQGAQNAQPLFSKPGDTPVGVPSPGNKPLNIKDSVAEYEQAFGYDPKTMTVEGRLEGLLDSDNKLVERARSRASQEAAARGLRNSTIAAQAGEEAAYNAALPIAQMDAENAMKVRMAAFGAAVEDQMLQKQHDFDLIKIEQEYQNNRGLAEQAFGFNTQLAEQSHGHRMAEGRQAGEFQLAAARIGAAATLGAAKLSANTQKSIAQMNAEARAAEAEASRAFTAEQNQLGREFTSSERQAGQEFSAEQAAADRAFRSEQADIDRTINQEQFDAKLADAGLDRASREKIADMQLTVSQQNAYLSAATTAFSSTQSALSTAAANGADKATQDMIKNDNTNFQNWLQSFFSQGIGG